MMYRKRELIVPLIVIIILVGIVLNGSGVGTNTKLYTGTVKKVELLNSMSSGRPAILTIAINEDGNIISKEVSGPLKSIGEKVKVTCSKRIITRGLFCLYVSE